MPEVTISGPAGDIEAVFTEAGGNSAAVLCHPHPQYGGSMDDGVIAVIESALQQAGISTVRFNFRGVGRSDGSYDNGIGESDDLRAVVEWLNHAHGAEQLLLAGYSFGGAVVLKVADELDCAALVLVAPGVGLLGEVDPPRGPALVIVGDRDQFFDQQMLTDYFDQARTQFEILEGADHFSVAMQDRLGPVVQAFAGTL